MQKEKRTYMQWTPPPIEKKREKKNRKKKNRKKNKDVPCIELANFDWII